MSNNPLPVPASVLEEQSRDLAFAIESASEEDRAALAAFRIDDAAVAKLRRYERELRELWVDEVRCSTERELGTGLAADALAAALRWRNDEVLPRVKLAFRDTPRLRHFRIGALRSHRVAVVLRETRLLVAAVRRFTHLPAARDVGLDEALVIEGQRLHQTILAADEAEVIARAHHEESEDLLREKAAEVARYLVGHEERVALAFSKDEVGKRRRYGIGTARTWLARSRGRKKAAARRRAQALAGE